MNKRIRRKRIKQAAKSFLAQATVFTKSQINAMSYEKLQFWVTDILWCRMTTPSFEPIGRSFIDRIAEE